MLLHPTYFPNIAHFITMAKANTIRFEFCDNYTKQTYRNRMYVYGANGKILLNIPVNYSQHNRQLYKDVQIANATNWQSLHWKTLESAYRTSPFFEFYEDDLRPLFESSQKFLLDFNLQCLEVVFNCLQLPLDYQRTNTFEKTISGALDYRFLVNSKKERAQSFEVYNQVFADKHGFLSNLSILDLLFNEGPNTVLYLKNQKVQC